MTVNVFKDTMQQIYLLNLFYPPEKDMLLNISPLIFNEIFKKKHNISSYILQN